MKEGVDIHAMKKMLADLPKDARASLLEELMNESVGGPEPDERPLRDDEKDSQSRSEDSGTTENTVFQDDQILRAKLSAESKTISSGQYLSFLLWIFLALSGLALLTYGLKSAVDWLRFM